MTMTLSPRRIFRMALPPPLSSRGAGLLKHLGRERNDAHELALAKLTADGTKDARPPRVSLRSNEHCRVVVKLDMATIWSAILLRRANDDRAHNLTLFHSGVRLRLLDRGDDDVTNAAILARRTAEYADAHDLPRPAVIGDLQSRLLLNHGPILCFSKRRPIVDNDLELDAALDDFANDPPL